MERSSQRQKEIKNKSYRSEKSQTKIVKEKPIGRFPISASIITKNIYSMRVFARSLVLLVRLICESPEGCE